MEILLVLAVGAMCIGCFIVGAKVGQTVAKGETIETPTVNPLKAIREHDAKKEAKIEQDRIEKIMQNIERYDGTSNGQVDVR
jgi:uncharacterized protein YneF (UPF0154 family)